MNLLDRYLQAVARLLPKPRRDDIIAELRSNLLSQMEDREEALGRPLTEEEQAEILRNHGNPKIVAGRYLDGSLGLAFGVALIGPGLFPYYKTVLIINETMTLLALAIILPMLKLPVTLTRLLVPMLAQFAIATAIFILIDRNFAILEQWDPRKLPPVKEPCEPRAFSFVIGLLGTLWLAAAPRSPYLLLGPGAAFFSELPIKLMPQWHAFYWAMIVLSCAHLMLQLFDLLRWLPRRESKIADIALRCLGLGLGMGLLWKAPNYVVPLDSSLQGTADWANHIFLICVVVALAINLWATGRLVQSILRDRHQMLPARQY